MRKKMPIGRIQESRVLKKFTLVEPGVIDLVFIQFFYEVGIIHPYCGKLLVRFLVFSFHCPGDLFRTDGQFSHIVFDQGLFELAVRNRFHF